MKIAWFHSHLLNVNSGGTRYVSDYARWLTKQGVAVDLFCDRIHPKLKHELSNGGVRVIELDSRSTYSPLYWLTLPFRIRRKKSIASYLAHRYDAILSSLFPMNLVVEKLSKPLVQICFEPFAFFYDQNFLRQFPLYHQIFFHIMKFCYSKWDTHATKAARQIITISETSQKRIQQIYDRKSKIVRAGINSQRLQAVSQSKVTAFRKQYPGSPLLLHTTDCSGIKGTEYLISALEKIQSKYPGLKLLLVYYLNNPTVLKKLQNRFQNHPFVTVLPAFPFDDLPVVYHGVDAVIQPNIGRAESWPLREALMAGTSIIGGEQSEEAALTKNALRIDITNLQSSSRMLDRFFQTLKKSQPPKSSPYDLDYNGKQLLTILRNTV